MKPSPISTAILVVCVVCLFLAPIVWAQAPATENQSAPAQRLSAAEVPRLIKFNSTLLDAQERPMSGPVGITFALYSQQTGGAALWLETQNVKPDAGGAYMVLLGANSANGVPAELFTSGEARWLGIQVGQQPEHERILLVSVPYALKAGDAETLGGLPASAFVTTEVPGNTANAGGASSTRLPKSSTATTPKKAAASTPQPATACSSLTSDGTATANSIGLFTAPCNLQGSVMSQTLINGFAGVNVAGNNAGLLLNGTGTHQVTVTGATSGRLGQDANGFFFASDTNGKSVRFLTNNGTLNEWMRITSAGNIGIGTTTPGSRLDVAGNLKISGAGALVFPDGTVQTSSARTRGITFLAGCDTCALLADTDSEKAIYVDVVGSLTIQSVACYSDAGNPIINIQRDTGVAANILTSNLTCSPTGASSTSFVVGQNVLNMSDKLDFAMVTAGGQAHRVTVVIQVVN